MQIYRVGGAVRDKILNNTYQDNDYVVVGSTIEEMLSLGFEKVGKSFPVFLHPKTKEEYALARRDIKTGLTHKDFKFEFTPDITLEEDSLRRDFTCNAIYEDITTGKLIDYHNGIKDIKNKTLRHISEHFKEDPLRVLRACRFSATLDFDIAPETINLCKQMVEEGAISHLSKTRIFQELEKALCSPYFYRFIENARKIGLLKELLPEVEDLFNVPEREDYHPEKNTGTHTMLALKAAQSNDSVVNLTILLHDIGKTATNKDNWPSHHHHEELGIDIANKILSRINATNVYKEFIPFTIKNHMLYHKNVDTILEPLAEIAIYLSKKQKNKYHQRFIAVLKADLKGRALHDFTKELDDFKSFEISLDKLITIAKETKTKLIPNFEELVEKLRTQKITKEEFKQIEIKTIINRAFMQ